MKQAVNSEFPAQRSGVWFGAENSEVSGEAAAGIRVHELLANDRKQQIKSQLAAGPSMLEGLGAGDNAPYRVEALSRTAYPSDRMTDIVPA